MAVGDGSQAPRKSLIDFGNHTDCSLLLTVHLSLLSFHRVLPLHFVAHSPRSLLHCFPSPIQQLSRPPSFLRPHDTLINSHNICFILPAYFCNLSFSLFFRIWPFRTTNPSTSTIKSLVRGQARRECMYVLSFDLQDSYLTTTTQHAARVAWSGSAELYSSLFYRTRVSCLLCG